MPEEKAGATQQSIESQVRSITNAGATRSYSSPGPAQSPQATINQMPAQAPTQAAVEAAIGKALKNSGRK